MFSSCGASGVPIYACKIMQVDNELDWAVGIHAVCGHTSLSLAGYAHNFSVSMDMQSLRGQS